MKIEMDTGNFHEGIENTQIVMKVLEAITGIVNEMGGTVNGAVIQSESNEKKWNFSPLIQIPVSKLREYLAQSNQQKCDTE
jgi:hypothetical protein